MHDPRSLAVGDRIIFHDGLNGIVLVVVSREEPCAPRLSLPDCLERLVDGDPCDVCAERGVSAERRQRAVKPDKRLLAHILNFRRSPEHSDDGRRDARFVPLDDAPKGHCVAIGGVANEIGILKTTPIRHVDEDGSARDPCLSARGRARLYASDTCSCSGRVLIATHVLVRSINPCVHSPLDPFLSATWWNEATAGRI